MKYNILKAFIEDGHEFVILESKMFGHWWVSPKILSAEVERFTSGNGACMWKLKDFDHKPQHRLELLMKSGAPFCLEWYYGEPHFWDAGRQGGKANFYTKEMLTLYQPGDHLMITDVWWSGGGFYHREKDGLHELYVTLLRKAVDAYVNDSSPADAIGYPGVDFPSTQHPEYTPRRGPAKSTIENPQKFLDDRQHKGGVMTPRSIDGTI